MENTNLLAFRKVINKSILKEGIPIVSPYRELIYQQLPALKTRGTVIPVKIYMNGTTYNIELYNQPFKEADFPNHPSDLLRFKYAPKSLFANDLRTIFHDTYEKVLGYTTTTKHLIIPDSQKEHIVFYFTTQPDTFIAECILASDINEEMDMANNYDETLIEEIMNNPILDPSSTIITRLGNEKIRKYNHLIGDNLKKLYENKCQICGFEFKGRYDVDLSEIHHIEYYAKSLNNNSDNLLVICPNHHRVIHKANPVFLRKSLLYRYPNGLEEEVTLKGHLIQFT